MPRPTATFSGPRSIWTAAGGAAWPWRPPATTATGTLTLALDADDPTKPQHESYQVLFTDAQGRGNNRPIRYRIEVVRDLPPEVKFTSPGARGGAGGGGWASWRSASRRRTPISACGGWRSARSATASACPSPRCWPARAGKGLGGKIPEDLPFQPAGLGLKAGDRVTYWAEAEDNKEPAANHAETGRRLITVVAGDHAESREGPQPHPARRNADQSARRRNPVRPSPSPTNSAPAGKQPPDKKN